MRGMQKRTVPHKRKEDNLRNTNSKHSKRVREAKEGDWIYSSLLETLELQ